MYAGESAIIIFIAACIWCYLSCEYRYMPIGATFLWVLCCCKGLQTVTTSLLCDLMCSLAVFVPGGSLLYLAAVPRSRWFYTSICTQLVDASTVCDTSYLRGFVELRRILVRKFKDSPTGNHETSPKKKHANQSPHHFLNGYIVLTGIDLFY